MKAVFLDFETYYPKTLDTAALKSAFEDFTFYDRTSPDETLERMRGAQVVLTNKVVISKEIIEQCPDLKLIIEGATGYNNIDVSAASAAGITVCNVKGYSTPAVSQHVFGLILALTMGLMNYHEDVKTGKWQESRNFCFLDYPIHELAGQTLGIIGYGDLGKNVETIAKAFGMKTLLADHKGLTKTRTGRTAFDDVITQSDIITLHCPLNEDTKNLIAMPELTAMKNSARIINTARGGIINESDLAQALRDGTIGGAGIDVLSTEPPTNGNPLLDPSIPNLIITPHTAWASRQACQRLLDQVVKVIHAYRAGNPMNVVS